MRRSELDLDDLERLDWDDDHTPTEEEVIEAMALGIELVSDQVAHLAVVEDPKERARELRKIARALGEYARTARGHAKLLEMGP